MQTRLWLCNNLCWVVGQGNNILVGLNTMVGMEGFHTLPMPIILYLQNRGLQHLPQIGLVQHVGFPSTHWYKAIELELRSKLHLEWETFHSYLTQVAIVLTKNVARLTWGGISQGDDISAKDAYLHILPHPQPGPLIGWLAQMWQWEVPLKIKCFTWLVVHNHILTWDNLLKRGFMGPSCCCLCKSNSEDESHLFLHYPFAIDV